jgi:hypothetical protein
MHDHEIDKGKGEMENFAGKANQQAPEVPDVSLCGTRDEEILSPSRSQKWKSRRESSCPKASKRWYFRPHPGIKETENASHRAGDEAA